ncbi:hypothetical protein IKF76_01190 [Candidatus Saccharibacteria bacterium]|nr:hypothetical protein [Candidatus Saccharibacteria bacterium]
MRNILATRAKQKSALNICYYTALSLCIAAKMFDISSLLNIPRELDLLMIVLSALFFSVKAIFSIKTRKQLLITAAMLALFLYIYFATGATFVILSFLAAVSITEVNIKNIVKIDIALKAFFLAVHLGFFFMALLLFPAYLPATNSIGAYDLYFTNSNSAPILALWLAIDILYISAKPSFKKYLALFVLMLILFFIGKSRTAFFCFIIFSLLHLIKNEKILTIMSRYAYLVSAGISFLIVNIVDKTSLYRTINTMFSSRLGYSIAAYRQTGLVLIPQPGDFNPFEKLIIDNFYVRCIVLYGIITLALYYIPIWLLNKRRAAEEKRISIVTSISLFVEYVACNVGFSIPFLIIASKALSEQNKKETKNGH